MKRWIAISFLFIFLTTHTALGQLLRLPTLVHHYLEHVEWDNNPSLIDFLATHYAGKINHPDDKHHDHENLPFKAIDNQTIQTVMIVPRPGIPLSRVLIVAVEAKKDIPDPQYYSNTFLNSIWQPPRFS